MCLAKRGKITILISVRWDNP
uniref:Uncharacterized protein n=1 Tax=Anopheles albimanus TaxID=7167 RepID=A0A182FWF3_ANOAL